ncbi:unnamed protein product [Didymodactylos carnosus]|uniref:Uncharacterized protein n=1 Tax=Didymodactylos carnosus TaxID=1234261 RepID=A0A8S2E0Q4_9BILA|nr:unnamed protein product [Didymodactylos carnosus]CAF3795840.1 unnamed protein product [Didymodactylos carnosus]
MKQMCEELNPVEAHNDEETEIMELDNESSNGSTEFEMRTSVQPYHQLLSVQTDNVCEIPVNCTISSHHMCCVCKIEVSGVLMTVSEEDRLYSFFTKNVFVPSGARCCPQHMINRRLTREAIDRLRPHYIRRISLSCGDILGLFAKVTIMMNNEKRFNFDDMVNLTNEDHYNLTGLSKEQLDHLMTMLSTLNLRNSPYRSRRTAVACLLAKMRLGISNRV